ncbi:HlyD family efflux transporter periplasmic adaptor subunit [Microvirga sp. VF16]|uniref:HlyD family efflux transporter periplasmic adaptor subunit n=1 Tax=Microvirga sp. VF16 TaxID=2807101 RepID=UPI00193C9892|nr:HlyD family efflux transporter periplasmic adaptor subunit [Microvirga sp. VF16]QRM34285.1 HlyD family secretion protein [Microvirga sp. VF16]
MSGIEASDVLRIAVISGLIGFGVFCASYSLSIWFKRNKAKPNRLARLSFLLLMLGIFGAASNWAYMEFSHRSGIVGGQDLFVVHAKRNVTTDKLAPEGAIKEGERLVEFIPPAIEGQLAVVDSHIKQSQAKIQALDLRALPVDALLLQRQAQLRTQIDQAKTFQFDLQKSRREVEKSKNDVRNQWTKEVSQIDLQTAEQREQLTTAAAQLQIAQTASTRATELRKNGIGTVNVTEEKTSNALTQALALNKAKASLASLDRYRVAVDKRYDDSIKALDVQQANIDRDLKEVEGSLALLSGQLTLVEKAVADDRKRAVDAIAREKEVAQHELEGLQAERVSTLAVTQVKAPFSGEVVYRHPAPGFAPENTPVLAVSKGSGFVARVWLPEDDVKKVQHAGKVQFALEQPILNRFFVGEFRDAEKAPFEKERVIAHFDAKLPLDAITLLASAGNPVPVRLLWRPNLFDSLAFNASLGLSALGFLGALASAMRGRAVNDDDVPQQQINYEARDQRLREMAQNFHRLLRHGHLEHDSDLVRGLVKLVNQLGEPAVGALRDELVFDSELEDAIQSVDDENVLTVLDRARGQITIPHVA